MKLNTYNVNESALVSYIFNDILELIEIRKWHTDRKFYLTTANILMGVSDDGRQPHLLFSLSYAIVELLYYQDVSKDTIDNVANKLQQHLSN